MSIDAADLKKLIKIVRQYEVIYGGGISTSDAAVREECEYLVGALDAELGSSPKSGGLKARRGSLALPSLVEAKPRTRAEKAPRPVSSRTSELVRLTKPDTSVSHAAPEAKGAKAGKGKAEPATAKGKAAPAATKGKAEPAPAKGKAAPAPAKGKAAPAIDKGGTTASGSRIHPDIRSRSPDAARAGDHRSDLRAGSARSAKAESSGPDPKRRFAASHLFDAYSQGKLPKYGGFIVCIRFAEELGYSIVEIIGYENLQDIYPDGEGLVFKSVGCKLYAIVEPPNYLLKGVEPVNRPMEQAVPYRFNELLKITTKRFQTLYVGRKPVFMPTSFSVLKPTGEDLAVLFYDIADVYSNIQDFLIMLFRDRMQIPVPDSRKGGEVIARGIREFHLWLDEA
ncbi:MAG TPA: hypothetical protein VFL04_00925 [Rectinemataceae bacterium]|nr:hypothetical protein [Rectinemataceae bacterium]